MRNTTISILKGIGILLMVFGHSFNQGYINDLIYSFHMPLFFIASGFFFKLNNVNNLKSYAIKKVNGLYLPFIKWSLIFLLLHNFFFHLGILNDKFGNTEGIVSQFYTLKDIIHHAINICIRMTAYEGFLLGAYWFMRALFVGSLLTAIMVWIFNRIHICNPRYRIVYIVLIFIALGGSMRCLDINIPLYPQGGYREVLAVVFIGMGYLFGQTQLKKWLGNKWFTIISTIALFTLSYLSPCNMDPAASVRSWATILITGPAGFIIIYFISQHIDRKNSKLPKLAY